MTQVSYINNANAAFIDDLYQQYKENPLAVDEGWRKFFDGYDYGSGKNGMTPVQVSDKEIAVTKLIEGYRLRGHLLSDTNPVRKRRQHRADLELEYYGLSDADLDDVFEAGKEVSLGPATLRQILDRLQKTYCDTIGVEFMYCRDEVLREWLIREMEPVANDPHYNNQQKRHILELIDRAVTFESFLQKKYVGKKRFSLEGLESLIPSLDAAIRMGADLGAQEFVLGMAHRGRLNVLVNVFGKTYEDVFSEFEESNVPKDMRYGGDVKYHLGRSGDVVTPEGHKVHLSLVPNPSHLEAVNPVVHGMVYAKQKAFYNEDVKRVIPIIIHGDAAIAGQGVNYEVSQMSKINGYSCGGAVHIVANNQIGFTANYYEGRSSVYSTDLAKVTESPVFHVNGDDPQSVVHAMTLAVKVRQQFNIDVYVDIVGYRRYGHNEGDEPRFTQPILYKSIDQHANIRDVFLSELVAQNEITDAEAKVMTETLKKTLQEKLDKVKAGQQRTKVDALRRHWKALRTATEKDFDQSVDTSVSKGSLDRIADALSKEPDHFMLFSKMAKLLKNRGKLYREKGQVDWALAELLGYGSLLIDGHPVRVSGQDSQRGTFSHRHAVLKDVETGTHYVPLNHIQKEQEKLEIYNSLLSEYAVLAFEYGMSLSRPDALIIWEAQFGDFSNGAQIVIDQFISGSEYKWMRMSGLMLLMPHGYEGQGPEHSSARPERFLQLCAQNNMFVLNMTTPANFFHALRRQVTQPFRKPAFVLSPKSLLRHPKVISEVEALTDGCFQEIIDDTIVKPTAVKKVLLCTGKLYYELDQRRLDMGIKDTAIVRLEQLYPISKKQISALKKRYKTARDWVWVQEEPINMGYWDFVNRHLAHLNLRPVARDENASPATGHASIHTETQEQVISAAFAAAKKR